MRRLAISSLLLAAPVWAQQFPEVEPNDLPTQAQPVPLGQQCNASLVAAESDWYSFTTPGGYHGISTSGGATASTDNRMTLWDSTGTTCLAYCDDGQSLCASLWMNLQPGTYLLRIDGSSTTSSGNYSLDISQPASKPLNGNEVEPNDSIATATLVANGAQLGASLTAPVVAGSDAVGAPGAVVSSHTVTSSTATVITTTGLTAGTWNGGGYLVRFTSGTFAGQSRRITANTATTITCETWGTPPAASDTFEVVNNAFLVTTGTVGASPTTTSIPTTGLVTGFYTPSGAYSMRMTSGALAGLSRTISSNSATAISTASWGTAPTAGDTFEIWHGGSTGSIVVATPLTAGQYNDQRTWLRCTSGANAGQSRCILRNTANVINLVAAFSTTPLPGDTFVFDQYDSDTYRIDVTAPLAQVVFSVTDGDDTFVSGWSYEVLDSLGNRIDAALYGTALADSSTFNPRVSSFRVLPSGTWYVRVFQRRTALTVTGGTVAFGNYRFEVKVNDMNVGGVVAETEAVGGPNTNNTIATAVALLPGQRGSGNITNTSGADSSDWWGPLTVTSQTLVCFQVNQGTSPALVDATANLRSVIDLGLGTTAVTAVTTGNILEAGNLNPRGSFNLLLPGSIYYIEVVSPGTGVGQDGNYTLDVSVLDAPTYTAGNFATIAANATGCGTPGVPTINRVQGSTAGSAFGELPIVGQVFTTRVTNLNGAGNFGLMVLGTSGALGPVYNPQPLDLTPVGAPGCTLNVNPIVIDVMFGDPSGTADYVINCPGNLAIAGFTLFMQPVKWDFSLNPLGVQPGNWLRAIFGTRAF